MAEIVAGAEAAALAGDDRHPQVVVGREVVEHLAEFGVRGRMQGIEALRTVDGYGHDVVGLVDLAELGHRGLPLADGGA